ncbi:MAG: zinc-binding dehydrogenase [Moorea sp. SIO2I5]|nr:zinc-binding dehydrogenase [Moorena sp. SIO2I5]
MDDQGTELVEIEEFTLRRVSLGKPKVTITQSAGTQNKELPPASERDNFYLTISSPGALDTLTFQPAPNQKPGSGEVEIEVGAAGLNFKEVLFALGLMPVPSDFNLKFGLECAGRIVALGEGVENFEVGDKVMAFGSSCFSQFITTPAQLVVPKPESLSLQEAATIPIAFTTAYYALLKLGRLRQGEKVLIHAAAGGVGMAAVQIAKWKGAQIFATAGSPEKRQFLHSLGIEHVMDSRSVAFADELMQYTDGKGVDMVLNSLGGEFIPKGLSVLARYGRFLELGQRDILNNSQLGLGSFEKCLSFFAIQVNSGLPEFNSLWCEVVHQFQEGHLSPLPYRVFPMTEVSDAFNYMARAKHIGKVVISLEDKGAIKSQMSTENTMGQEVQETLSFSTALSHQFPISSVNPGKLKKTGLPVSKSQQQVELLENGLSPSEGIEVFNRILGSIFPQVLVSNNNLIAGINSNSTSQTTSYLETFEKPDLNFPIQSIQPIQPTHSRPDLSNAYVASRNETEQKIAHIWQNLLGIERVGIHDNFFELGGDSILAVQVRSKLQETFNKEFLTTDLFEYPTISELAGYISQKQVEKNDFQQAHDRAEMQQEAMQEEIQLIERRSKRRG